MAGKHVVKVWVPIHPLPAPGWHRPATGVHVKVSVDRNVCYGSFDCVHRVPSVFTRQDGYGAVLPGREDMGDDRQVQEAADWCPSQAITFTE
ncbi:ferredoxin [Streptomyces sp. NPDC058467]|uniref:ferredoxin n=1 Tax=Streptomyces sp. NPDC058467 TaxID=3346513 RepID=UPI00365C1B4E